MNLPVQAQMNMDGTIINADTMDGDNVKRQVYLKGNVQIIFQEQHLSCDRATIDFKKQEIEAYGHVILQNQKVYAEANHVKFNYKSNTGVLYDGFVQSGQVIFEGQVIEKVGDNEYIAERGSYTACATCPPAWSFSGRRIHAEFGGYARIRRPVLRLGGVPVLILPGIIVPLKSSRQSGFLVPSADYSKSDGLAIGESFFWAISRSQDMTLAGKWYQLRGTKALTDYRYVLSDKSSGRLQGAWIHDRQFQEEVKLNESIDRWFLHYSHGFELPNGFTHRMDIKPISDLWYLRDFPEEMGGTGDPSLENKMSLTKNSKDQHFSAEAILHTNLLKSNPLDRNRDSVHRAPEINYSLKDTQLFGKYGPLFRFDANYVNFTRDSYSYDDLKTVNDIVQGPSNDDSIARDGTFKPNVDLIRTGQRVDLQPKIYYPFQIANALSIEPSLTYRETQYRFYLDKSDEAPETGTESATELAARRAANYGPTAARRYLDASLSLKTELSQVYGNLHDEKANRYKHIFQQEMIYSTIPWIRTPDHSFFGDYAGQQYIRSTEPISDQDLGNRNKVQFDYNDRVFDKNIVNFVLTNKLIRRQWSANQTNYQTTALFRLSQSYDFYEAKTDKPQPWSPLYGLLQVQQDHFETYTTAAYNTYAKITNLSSRIKLLDRAQNFIQFSYSRGFIVNEVNEVQPNSETENIGLGIGFNIRYLTLQGQTDYSNITQQIQSWSYIADIHPPGNCWNIIISHEQIVGARAPHVKAYLGFQFGGDGQAPTTGSTVAQSNSTTKTN